VTRPGSWIDPITLHLPLLAVYFTFGRLDCSLKAHSYFCEPSPLRFLEMSSVIYQREGPHRWDPGQAEQFPPNISLPYPPKAHRNKPKKEHKKGIHRSAIAPDGSKAVLATEDRLFVYQVRDSGATTAIAVDYTPVKNDEIKGVDISNGVLAVATVKRLLLFVFDCSGRDAVQSHVQTLFFRRRGWSPTCLVLSHNQGATWLWVAVGGVLDVNLYLYRLLTTGWTLQQDRPTLRGCPSDIRSLCASPNFSDSPYATIFAGACDYKLGFWNLRLWDRQSATLGPVHTIAVPAEDVSCVIIRLSTCAYSMRIVHCSR